MGIRTEIQKVTPKGMYVDIHFKDEKAYRFHALWLRDACQDSTHLKANVGERILTSTPIMTNCPEDLSVKSAFVNKEGELCVTWSDMSPEGTYSGQFIRSYADTVAKPLQVSQQERVVDPSEWMSPFSGFHESRAPTSDMVDLWKNDQRDEFPRYKFSMVKNSTVNLEPLQKLMRHGVVIIEDVPEAYDASILHDFANYCLGGLQKDPARKEANWTITRKDSAASISYNPDLRLNNHTDQSLPSAGIPALGLVIHYADGQGNNTLTDGFAVANALQEQDPDAYKLLTTCVNEQERDLVRSRVDATQNHTQSLLISMKKPILQTDPDGNVMRLQYNEVFRVPSTLSYDIFPKWYAAYMKFARMIHSKEFERLVPMKKGQILVMNNWRVLHGRAGHQSPDRTLFGGSVTREAIYSRSRQLMLEVLGVKIL
jgi:alpha-ketoglutarate-dependent taurine dioxygenase